MTIETKQVVEKWIEENRMGPPIHGDVYSSNLSLTDVGIDGQIDLAELVNSIEASVREQCAKIADEYIWPQGWTSLHGPGEIIARKIRE